MKKILATLAVASFALPALPQGSILFHNLVGGSNPDTSIRAPIFGPEGNNPNSMVQLQGQSATASSFPAGSQVYTGDRLAGTGYTAELFGGPLGAADMDLTASMGGRVSAFSTGAAAGYFTAGVTAIINGVPAGSSARLQVRAWDNRGGTVTSWAQVLLDPTILRGWSPAFDSRPTGGVGVPPSSPPNMIGMQSFNLFVVPEPSVIALGALGLGALLLRRIRRQ
jgi:hypothetical protein